MPTFNPTFVALLKEAQFTKELLGAGATQIRRANYATKGIYFQSFTNLSTGLERIGKLCLALDHYIETNGSFPDFNYMKNVIGHDLVKLREKALDVVARRNLGIQPPAETAHLAIVQLLSEFANGDRYSNINLLVGANRQSDPVASWFTLVDQPLYELRVPQKKKQTIADNARVVNQIMGSFSRVLHTSETGSDITDMEDASLRTGIYDAVAPLRQLHVLHIIRFWSELLSALQYPAQALGREDIPFFGEIFGAFRNDDSYMRTRKTWDTV